MKTNPLKLIAMMFVLGFTHLSCSTLTDIMPAKDDLIPIAASTPYYLSEKTISSFNVTPPPPIHSVADQKYIGALKTAQQNRTAVDCKRAKIEASAVSPAYQEFFGSISPFAKPIGGEERDFFIRIWSDALLVSDTFKKKYDWPRAYTTDKALLPCLKKTNSAAFPSEHALLARIDALALAEIDPKNSDRYLDRANAIAKDDLTAGMHRPNELKAGQELADQMFSEFLKSQSFRQDLAQMKAILVKNAETK